MNGIDEINGIKEIQTYNQLLEALSRLCPPHFKYAIIRCRRKGPAGINAKLTGKKMKAICLEHGVTAKQLQKELDISFQSVYAWFAGKSLPSLDNMYELSGILGVPIDQMLVGAKREVCFFVNFEQDDSRKTQKVIVNYFTKLQIYHSNFFTMQ